jgi:hypothetical protein
MDRNTRELKKEVEALVNAGEIEDFAFTNGGKHPEVSFQYRGDWHAIPYGRTPRTPYGNNYMRQQIRRKIRGLESGFQQNNAGAHQGRSGYRSTKRAA